VELAVAQPAVADIKVMGCSQLSRSLSAFEQLRAAFLAGGNVRTKLCGRRWIYVSLLFIFINSLILDTIFIFHFHIFVFRPFVTHRSINPF
jgi:hypothetical protein